MALPKFQLLLDARAIGLDGFDADAQRLLNLPGAEAASQAFRKLRVHGR